LMVHQVSPLAPAELRNLPPIKGVKLSAAEAAIRYRERPDVMLALLEPQTTIAGAFTRSLTRSAPVEWCAAHVGATARAIIVNAGNANAFTGRAGVACVKAVAKGVAAASGCKPSEVFIASTGVIGEPLDPTLILRVVPQLMAAGRVRRGYLGIAAQRRPIEPRVVRALGLASAAGVEIASVEASGPAAAAGLRAGDVIVALGEEAVATVDDLHRLLASWPSGSPAALRVVRGERAFALDVVPGETL